MEQIEKMTPEEIKNRYEYFCSHVRAEDIIKDWTKLSPEEKKKHLTPQKI